MRIMWICNQCIPMIATQLNIETGNKEGWLAGMSERLVAEDSDIEFAVCFPGSEGNFDKLCGKVKAYGFAEDTANPQVITPGLKERFQEIYADFKPDVIHIFGTEYGHTLEACRAAEDKNKILIGIQGICEECAKVYLKAIPEKIARRYTLRDLLKKDNLTDQKNKFTQRAGNEIEALKLAGNVAGRTSFDYEFAKKVNPDIKYHVLNETLRSSFYTMPDNLPAKEKHSVFITQGNYPIKGLHVFLEALPKVIEKYPDLKVYVAGDIITGETSLKKKILISSYGLYLKKLIKTNKIKDNIVFTGNMNAGQIKERLLQSSVFCLPSMVENSPNSLGEAMLLKVPCVAARVGGIPDMIEDNTEGILYESTDRNDLSNALIKVLEGLDNSEEWVTDMCEKAEQKARKTHDADKNFLQIMDIYGSICK